MQSTVELTAQAYLVRGGVEAVDKVLSILEKSGIGIKGNADVLVRAYTSFSMEDARALRERATLRGRNERGRVFIVAAPTIAPDAQNALLKTFEEPSAGAKFFLIVPAPETLLPTLRSRMQMLKIPGSAQTSPVDIKEFLKAGPEKRAELLKPLLEKGDDDKRDLSGTIAFLCELERALSRKPAENEKGLNAVYRARKYITDRGALAKSLLEQTAFIVPKMLS